MFIIKLLNIKSSKQNTQLSLLESSSSQVLLQVLGVSVSPSALLSPLGLSSLLALRISALCAQRGLRISVRALLAPEATAESVLGQRGAGWGLGKWYRHRRLF